MPAARAMRMARSGPLSGFIRPRNIAYPPPPGPNGKLSTSIPWWMTAVIGTSSRECWSCEIATTEPTFAAAQSSGRVWGDT